MAVPDYQTMMLPFLQALANGEEHSLQELTEAVAKRFNLSEEDRRELLPSGNQTKLANRVGWVRTYLKKAGLLENTRRAHFRITESGKQVLQENPSHIDAKSLRRFPSFVEFKDGAKRKSEGSSKEDNNTERTLDEAIEEAHLMLREELAAELLENVKGSSPVFFEKLVIDLLVKMGYGGSRREAGEATKQSNDEGIDGIIKEDRLGLDIVYLQAKKWEAPVSRPEIQKFAGALQGQRARKGVFITTSTFSRQAEDFVKNIDSKIILIDGKTLANYMIEHNVGVSLSKTFEIKRMDTDYFEE